MRLPVEHLNAAAREAYRAQMERTGVAPDLSAADHALMESPDGRFYLRVSFPDGTAWELPFGPEADAMLEAVRDSGTATRH